MEQLVTNPFAGHPADTYSGCVTAVVHVPSLVQQSKCSLEGTAPPADSENKQLNNMTVDNEHGVLLHTADSRPLCGHNAPGCKRGETTTGSCDVATPSASRPLKVPHLSSFPLDVSFSSSSEGGSWPVTPSSDASERSETPFHGTTPVPSSDCSCSCHVSDGPTPSSSSKQECDTRQHIEKGSASDVSAATEPAGSTMMQAGSWHRSGYSDSGIGEMRFTDSQLLVFDKLNSMMSLCCVMWLLLTLSDIISTVTWALRLNDSVARQGVSYSNAAAVLQDGIMAFVIFSAARSFHNLRSKTNHLPYVLQGLLQLSHLFLQLAFFVISVSLIQLVEAVVMCPAIKYAMYPAVTLLALARSIAVTYLQRKYRHHYLTGGWRGYGGSSCTTTNWLETLALVLSGSFVVPGQNYLEADSGGGRRTLGRLRRSFSLDEYEFTFRDEQILLAVINAMRICGSMSVMQAFVMVLLGAAHVQSGRVHKALGSCMDVTGQLAMASTVFWAAQAFQMIVTTKGRDVSNLLRAVGDKGLINLFGRLSNIAASLVVVQTAEVGWRLYSSDYSSWLTPPLATALMLMVAAGGWVKLLMIKLPKQEQVLRLMASGAREMGVQGLWNSKKKKK